MKLNKSISLSLFRELFSGRFAVFFVTLQKKNVFPNCVLDKLWWRCVAPFRVVVNKLLNHTHELFW